MVDGRRKQREVKPRQYPSENKRPTISFRVRADTFENLKASAKEHDLSLSEEVERCVNFKFTFARDAHDEIVMKSLRAAFDMAEKVAGARWFENREAARLCHDALKGAAALLMLGVGPGNQLDLVSESVEAGAAIGGQAVSNVTGMNSEESKQRYEAVIAKYRDAVRFNYTLVKLLSGGESDENASAEVSPDPTVRPATPDEIANMVDAPGQLPESIGGQAAFDDAVAGLPLVQAEKAAEKSVPETAPTRRKARAKTKTEA